MNEIKYVVYVLDNADDFLGTDASSSRKFTCGQSMLVSVAHGSVGLG
jgi:hypothetical protein